MKFYFTNDSTLTVEGAFDYELNGDLIVVMDREGVRLTGVNLHQILYFEFLDEEEDGEETLFETKALR